MKTLCFEGFRESSEWAPCNLFWVAWKPLPLRGSPNNSLQCIHSIHMVVQYRTEPAQIWKDACSFKMHLGSVCRLRSRPIVIYSIVIGKNIFYPPSSIRFVWLPTNVFSFRFLQYWGRIGSENNMSTCHRPTCRKEGVLLDYSTDGGKCLLMVSCKYLGTGFYWYENLNITEEIIIST